MSKESVNVLVTSSIGEECLRLITATSPKIKILDASDLVDAEQRGDLSSKEQLDAMLAEAEVIYGFGPTSGHHQQIRNVITRAPKLRWIHCMLSGVDHFLDAEIAQSQVIVTNALSLHGTQMSELVFELMLMLVKQAPYCFQLKQERQWKPFAPAVLRSKTLGIVGLGRIGREVARLAKAFGMQVIANRRSAKRGMRARYVDKILPADELRVLLSASDFVVIVVPLTPETNKLIGKAELQAMKSTAYLINVARGAVVDEEALVCALDENWIAGAALDVVTAEPLPADSRLWDLPNLIISPHLGGRIPDYNVVTTELFCRNIKHYLDGENLLFVVDKKKGY